MIYLASPYTHKDPDIRHKRFLLVRSYCVSLINAGEVPFSPIVYTHEMAVNYALPTDALSWEKFNTAFIRQSSAMHVLQIEGWDKSVGVAMEIDLAAKLFIPITYVKFYEND